MSHKFFIGTIIAAAAVLALMLGTSGQTESACAQGILCPAPQVHATPLSG